MKSLKTSSLFRLAALLVIVVIAICMVGFVAEGWQSEPQKLPESGETDENSGNTDENTGGGGETVTPDPPTPPKYYHYLTGLEIPAEEYSKRPICFVLDTASPLYGIHGTSLMIEIPIENGKTRFLAYHNDLENLGKIGSITKGRECVARLLDFFGGIAIQNGYDGSQPMTDTSPSRIIFDLSTNTGHSYKENTNYLYSNKDLLLAGLQNSGISLTATETYTLPFVFSTYADPIHYRTAAQTVILPYSESNVTGLCYDSNTSSYILEKGGQVKTDLLNGKNAAFQNAFILFADSTTYESVNQTEMTIDTDGGGKGYCFTAGTVCTIEWQLDATGKLTFTTESGETLIVNRGASYIAFYKASLAENVTFA